MSPLLQLSLTFAVLNLTSFLFLIPISDSFPLVQCTFSLSRRPDRRLRPCRRLIMDQMNDRPDDGSVQPHACTDASSGPTACRLLVRPPSRGSAPGPRRGLRPPFKLALHALAMILPFSKSYCMRVWEWSRRIWTHGNNCNDALTKNPYFSVWEFPLTPLSSIAIVSSIAILCLILIMEEILGIAQH